MYRMPSFSATDCTLAATGNRPVATSGSHPSATAGSLSNCSAINSAARRGTSATDGGVAPCSSDRTGGPSGTSGTPNWASRSAQSGGAHTRASAPSCRNRTARATSGSTSPRPPYVDNSTRTSRLPVPQVLASAGDSAARPGSCRKPPGALYVESGREWIPSFPSIVRCGRTTSSIWSLCWAPHQRQPQVGDGVVVEVKGECADSRREWCGQWAGPEPTDARVGRQSRLMPGAGRLVDLGVVDRQVAVSGGGEQLDRAQGEIAQLPRPVRVVLLPEGDGERRRRVAPGHGRGREPRPLGGELLPHRQQPGGADGDRGGDLLLQRGGRRGSERESAFPRLVAQVQHDVRDRAVVELPYIGGQLEPPPADRPGPLER